MADVSADLKNWSNTASSNAPAGGTAVGTGLDDNLREIQKVVRQDLATKGSDIASATTTDVGAVAGLMHDITGTTTITGLGTVSAGIWKVLKFEGALTLTHNATSLILPGAANITTADGDIGIFISEGSGNWRCVQYTKATGGPVKALAADGFSQVLLSTQQASASATVSFASVFSSTYDVYEFRFTNVLLTTAATSLYARVGSGGSYDSAGNDYTCSGLASDGAQNQWILTDATSGVKNTIADGCINGVITVYAPSSTSSHKRMKNQLFYQDAGPVDRNNNVWGTYAQTSAITDIQFLPSSSTIASGTIRAYGIKNS